LLANKSKSSLNDSLGIKEKLSRASKITYGHILAAKGGVKQLIDEMNEYFDAKMQNEVENEILDEKTVELIESYNRTLYNAAQTSYLENFMVTTFCEFLSSVVPTVIYHV